MIWLFLSLAKVSEMFRSSRTTHLWFTPSALLDERLKKDCPLCFSGRAAAKGEARTRTARVDSDRGAMAATGLKPLRRKALW